MAATIIDTPPGRSEGLFRTATEGYLAGGSGDGTWVQFGQGPVTVGVGGDASAFAIQVWRSFGDPLGFSAIMMAGPQLTGAAGEEPPEVYEEHAVGWWRVEVITVTGGAANVGMSGSIP